MPYLDATVEALYRYPVKSMLGELVDEIRFDSRGPLGDREWAVTYADGRVGSGKTWKHVRRLDGLLEYTARTRDGRVEVHTPDGAVLLAGSPELDARLTALAGEPVRALRETATPHVDIGAVHLISRSSLAALATEVPNGTAVPVARFRPNLVVDGAWEDGAEEGWVGRKLLIGGSTTLEITELTERCVMVTLPQSGLPRDKEVLRVLAGARRSNFGVYAKVVSGGRVARGDRIRAS
ncbi:MOSC domain-containing protein [Actinoplanes sp. NPDC049548]|uniref:MOSC domain-containing protein n=1 Tax=Actinoplanes sp. NPDC049548 TaxID=3155152 RepID=UPI00342A1015